MKVKEIYQNIKKGVKAGMMAIQDQSLNSNRILELINEFNNSNKRKLMLTGQRYYEVDNDILKRKMTRKVKGKVITEDFKANNKLAHSKYKGMVDEKVAYLLSRPYTLDCDQKDYLEKVKECLGKHFQYTLSGLGYEASNKGIGWLHIYIDEKGKFKTMLIDSEQCIPIWKDKTHIELEMMIRVYETYVWQFNKRKCITNVEVWTEEGVSYYKQDGKMLIPYTENNQDEGGPVAHFKKNGEWAGWGKVPFIPFKNNRIEIPDIKFVKSLIDGYDLSRSDVANYIEEVKNLIFILKGYDGDNVIEFMKGLNENRAVVVDEDGDVNTLNPTVDITAVREHYEQLKRDLIEDGQSINKDLDKFGSAPSGVALKFMYSGLDLKCNALETEFKMGFEELLYFINMYLSIMNLGNYENVDLDILFNRDMEINETEVITNCSNSKGIISDETILGNHPWIKDVETEKQRLIDQQREMMPDFDKVIIGEDE